MVLAVDSAPSASETKAKHSATLLRDASKINAENAAQNATRRQRHKATAPRGKGAEKEAEKKGGKENGEQKTTKEHQGRITREMRTV